MSTLQLTKTIMRQGVWQGIVTQTGTGVPQIEVTHQERPLPDVSLTRDGTAEAWTLSFPIPADAIADGVQTLVIRDKLADTRLGHVTLLAGDELDADIRAELDLLRAELDLLKRAFRRHCLEAG